MRCQVISYIKGFIPCWCGSVDRVLTCEVKGHWFNSQSGACLGCGPHPQFGARERQLIDVSLTHRYFSPSLSPFLPLSVKINKQSLKQNEKGFHLKS